MRGPIKKGSTDVSVSVLVIDSTTGAPETGVTFESAGIDLWYWRESGTKTAITEATLATVDAAHSDGGFIHVADGVCRLDLPDAAFAAGAGKFTEFGGTITGMLVIGGAVELEDENLTGLSARIPTALTGDGNIKADALKINTATPSTLEEQAAAFLAAIADGTEGNAVTVKTALAHCLAMASGEFTVDGNDLIFEDRDGDPLFTLTLAVGARTRS